MSVEWKTAKSSWVQIPGYEGLYWINRIGAVKNSNNRILQPIPSKDGLRVELRKDGQRDRPLIMDLMKKAGVFN